MADKKVKVTRTQLMKPDYITCRVKAGKPVEITITDKRKFILSN